MVWPGVSVLGKRCRTIGSDHRHRSSADLLQPYLSEWLDDVTQSQPWWPWFRMDAPYHYAAVDVALQTRTRRRSRPRKGSVVEATALRL